jgi:hypothetical protein
MPLANLFKVTKALQDLIGNKASARYASTVGTSVLSPQEDLTVMTPVVNIYLHHLIENAHYKNQPPRNGSGPVPIQHTPIGLDLFYVLTVRAPDSPMRVAVEHEVLGVVAKVVHDFPIVAKPLLVDPTILDDDDHFDLILRPVSNEESMNFWSGDEQHLMRPSLFVEARVIQLEPEPPQILPGIVLTLGTFVFAGRGPQLVTSRSQIAFVPPGFGVQRVSSEPARVALFEQGADPWVDPPAADAQPLIRENNRLTLVGTGLGRGRPFLELTGPNSVGPDPVRIDLAPSTLPGPNPDWQFEVLSDRITLRFFTEVEDVGANLVNFFPGIFLARVVLEEEPRASVSNQIAFAVIPQITDVAIDTTGASFLLVDVFVMGDYLGEPSLEFFLVVGDLVFTQDTALDQNGEFAIVEVALVRRVRFRIATPASDAFPVPINLTINGAQATPAWLEGP